MTAEELRAMLSEVLGSSKQYPSPANLPRDETDYTKVATSAIQATAGLISVGKTGAEAATVLGTFAGFVPLIGAGTQKFIGMVEEARLANIKNANAGLASGVIYGDLNYKTQALGLTQEAFRGLLQNSGGSLNSLGMTADIGAKRLLDVGLKAQDLGKEFIINGNISQDQLARTTALAQYGSRVTLDNAKAQADAASSTIELAKEIDSVVKVTGRSRDAITGELEERLKSPVVQSALNMATEEQRKGIIQSQAQLSGMGKGVSDLSATLAINGRLTKDQQMQLQTLGPAAGEFQRASRMAALAQSETERKQAADAMVAARAKISEYQASQQFATAMKNSTPEVSQYYQRAYQENQERGRVQAGMRETGMDAVGSRAQSAVLAGRDQEGIDANNKRLAERELGRLAQEAQFNASIQAAGTGKAFAELSIQLGNSPDKIAKLDGALKTVFGNDGSIEAAAVRMKGAVNDIFEGIANTTGAGSGSTTAAGNGVTENLPKVQPKPGSGQYPSATKLADGTKDAFGSWFGGPSDMLANIRESGPEAVVPQGKISEFISDMMSKLPKPGSQQDQGAGASMPSMPSPLSMQSQSMDSKTMNDLHKQLVDLNTSIKEVSTKMSSVSDNTASTAKYSKAATGNRNA
jgi:hypothetical protein